MHSSRMRTGRTLTVFRSLLFRGGGGGLVPGGVPAWSRGVWSRGVPTWSGGVPGQVLPPPVNRMTHTCKNITLAKTSFRPVKIYNSKQVEKVVNQYLCIYRKHDIFKKLKLHDTKKCHRCSKQESIPVGCVLPACKPPDVAFGGFK